jgi:hypothetical protein
MDESDSTFWLGLDGATLSQPSSRACRCGGRGHGIAFRFRICASLRYAQYSSYADTDSTCSPALPRPCAAAFVVVWGRRRPPAIGRALRSSARRMTNEGGSAMPQKHRAAIALALFIASTVQAASSPANTLLELWRELGACVRAPSESADSELTIVFALKRDGSLLGKPRITHSRRRRRSEGFCGRRNRSPRQMPAREDHRRSWQCDRRAPAYSPHRKKT